MGTGKTRLKNHHQLTTLVKSTQSRLVMEPNRRHADFTPWLALRISSTESTGHGKPKLQIH